MFITGFMSTTLDKKRALKFALGASGDIKGVLMVIKFNDWYGYHILNNKNLSQYDQEQEVLIKDGH